MENVKPSNIVAVHATVFSDLRETFTSDCQDILPCYIFPSNALCILLLNCIIFLNPLLVHIC